MDIILTHENADFDAVAGLLAASRIYPNALPVLPERLNNNVTHFLTLYENGLPFIRQRDVQSNQVSGIIVVDTQRAVQIKGITPHTPLRIIDHHPLAHELKAHETFSGELVGAVTTLLVEQIRHQGRGINSLEATLLILGIYEDTGSLTYGTTTSRDIQAAAWLVEQGGVLDTVRRFLSHPLTEDQQRLLESLVAQCDSRVIEGYTVIIASAVVDHYVAEISSVAHRMRDILESTALFVLVQMPNTLQLVARSTDDAIDVGVIARLFGGGGHGRAAAASIHDRSVSDCAALIWQELLRTVRPVTRVADLMSRGAQTVDAGEKLEKIVRKLRRIGHEGYPVVEDGQIVGLLTRRDLDRAVEHGLGNLRVRDVMMSGNIVLHLNDSVFMFEQRIVESGWGQIPVVDDAGVLIGIVTRTDLIKHWAHVHPVHVARERTVSPDQIKQVLGQSPARLIDLITARAQEMNIKLYLVGGVVRDLLLSRQNLDIDFVLEERAIDFARSLERQYGGHVSAFTPFGTAKWVLDEAVAQQLHEPLNQLPEHIDFATARNEFYEHPTALPTVYNGSIKLDLQRRDFTINTLAIQLSPAHLSGIVLDYYGGMADLEARRIRVLHSLSFVDDPTRILRAIRFERRLNFTVESRTADLITSALPMLGRITGERLRNELTLLLKEQDAAQGLLELQQRAILQAIHPLFVLDARVVEWFQSVHDEQFPWSVTDFERTDLYWHVLFGNLLPKTASALCERLMFGRSATESIVGAAAIQAQRDKLGQVEARPSEIVHILSGITELALLAVWLISADQMVQDRIRNYQTTWQHVHPVTNGHTLREIGLKPGPCYSMILSRLRDACIDGEVHDADGERKLLDSLIHDEGICNDSP